MTKQEIINALSLLNTKLGEKQAVGEICIFGGAVMVLVFRERNATKDIDAIFHPSRVMRACAESVARELGLPAEWLNDGVKGFIARPPATQRHPRLPRYDHLNIVMPTAEYLLAMKCLASRVGAGQTDRADAKTLASHLGYTRPEQVHALLEAFYPADMIPARTQYFIEELFHD